MTVYQYSVIALIAAALCLAILSGVFFVPRSELKKQQQRHVATFARYRDTINFCYDEICNRELLRHKDLPQPSLALYARICDAYIDPELKLYKIPMGYAPDIDSDAEPATYYWKSLPHELSACELAQLWLRGII